MVHNIGLEWTQDFATLPGRTGHPKFSGHVLPDRTNTGPPFLVKQSVKCIKAEKNILVFWIWVLGGPGAQLLHP